MAELSIPSLLFFLLGRPGLCLLVAISMAGYGSLLEKDKHPFHPLCFSTGLYIKVLLLWVLGFLHLWTSPVLWMVNVVGIGLAIWQIRKFGGIQWPSLPKTWPDRLITCLFAVWFVITFIRCSAPPYFIDYLQYHLPLSQTFLHAEGFSSLEDFFFGALNSNFAPETFHLLLIGCSGDTTAPVLFNLVLFSLVLYQLYFYLIETKIESQFYTCAALLMGCQTFFHSTIYGKTEIFLMFICMDLLLRWNAFKKASGRIHSQVWFVGVTISMLSFFKISAGLISVGCLAYAFSLPQIRQRRHFMWLLLGLCIPIPFYLIQRQITLGMPLFPFIIDPSLVPSFLSEGISTWSKGENIVFADRIQLAIQQTFFGGSLRHFNVRGFLLILISAIFLPNKNKRFYYGALVTLLFLHWGTWLMQYRFAISTLRLSLPFFLLAVPFFALRVSKSHIFIQRCYLWISIFGLVFLISKEGRILPGLKVHLGIQSKKEYFINMNIHVGVLYEQIKPILNEQQSILVLSEYAGAVTHPKAHFVNMSKTIHQDQFNPDLFLGWIQKNEFKSIILDRPQNYPKVFSMLKSLETEGKIKLKTQYRDAQYYTLQTSKNEDSTSGILDATNGNQ